MTRSDLKKYFADSRDIIQVAGVEQTGAGRALYDVVRKKIEEERAKLELNPRVSDNAREDFRYQLGFIAGLKFIESLPREVSNFVKD